MGPCPLSIWRGWRFQVRPCDQRPFHQKDCSHGFPKDPKAGDLGIGRRKVRMAPKKWETKEAWAQFSAERGDSSPRSFAGENLCLLLPKSWLLCKHLDMCQNRGTQRTNVILQSTPWETTLTRLLSAPLLKVSLLVV